jgi:hypothetical protein
MAVGYPSKSEITRALQAAHCLGLKIMRYEVNPRGQIRVYLEQHSSAPEDAFDEWMRSRGS